MIYTAHDVNEILKERIEDFCHAFLAGGHREGAYWRCKDYTGAPGNSFVVHLSGPKQGLFYENGGDKDPTIKTLIDIYMRQKRYRQDQFRDALAEMKEWLGIKEDGGWKRVSLAPKKDVFDDRLTQFADGKRPKEQRPNIPIDWASAIDTPAEQYLAEERGLPNARELIEKMRIGYAEINFRDIKNVPSIVYPAYSDDGENCLMAKFKSLARFWRKGPLRGQPEEAWRESFKSYEEALQAAEGTHPKRMTKSSWRAEYHLIGMHEARGPEIIVAEGEEDWLSWVALGYQAVSVPFGAKADKSDGQMNEGNAWISNDWDYLAAKKDIMIAMDADEEGRKATETLARRLGTERVLIVTFPQEDDDANQVFQRDPDELHDCYESAQSIDPEDLKRAREFKEEVWDLFFPADGKEPGYPPPFPMPFRFRPGEGTVWTGYNKHGKTICQTFTMVHFASLGARCCIASMEMQPAKTLQNAARMAMGRAKPGKWMGDIWEPDPELWDRTVKWLDKRFFLFAKMGEQKLADILRVFKYAARRYGCDQFILDSLMKLDCGEEDYAGQKAISNALEAFAQEYNVHIHIVAHSKKADASKRDENKHPPRKHDVSGTSKITDIFDNCIVIFRNKQKAKDFEHKKVLYDACEEGETKQQLEEDLTRIDGRWDAQWIVEGQRHGTGEEPIRYLWFDKGEVGSWQYFGSLDDYNKALDEGRRVYILEDHDRKEEEHA